MNKQFFIIIVTLGVVALKPLSACGPDYGPRYPEITHLDPAAGFNVNFGLIYQFMLGIDPNSYHYSHYNQNEPTVSQKIQTMIDATGRNIALDPTRFKAKVCHNNTKQQSEEFLQEVTQLHADYKETVRSTLFKPTPTYKLLNLVKRTFSLCGPKQNQSLEADIAEISSAEMSADFSRFDDFKRIGAIAFVRYYTYTYQFDKATPWIAYLEGLPDTSVKKTTDTLKQELIKLSQPEQPILIYPSDQSYRNYPSWGRCRSNSLENIQFFIEELLGSSLSDQQALTLIRARLEIFKKNCGDEMITASELLTFLGDTVDAKNDAARVAIYLRAIRYFYAYNYSLAIDLFNELSQTNDVKFQELGVYMTARTLLLSAQLNWNGYSRKDTTIDKEKTILAAERFKQYIADYPNGQYVRSATGLIRRSYYLANNMANYQTLLSQQIMDDNRDFDSARTDESKARVVASFNEWRLYTPRDVDYASYPLLYIAYDVLRKSEGFDDTYAKLMAVQARFNDHGKLFEYLSNYLLYRAQRYTDISTNKDVAVIKTSLDVGLASIQAKARFHKGDFIQARSVWEKIHTSSDEQKQWQSVLLEIAKTYIASNDYEGLSHKGSHVEQPLIFQDAFRHLCREDRLLRIANSKIYQKYARHAARDELFTRTIVKADFKALHQLYTSIDDVGEFSLIQTAASKLAKDADNINGLLNVGYFMLKKMQEPMTYTPLEPRERCESSYFNGDMFGPREYLGRVLALSEQKQNSIDEAKALHYLVMCDKVGYHSDECNWGTHKVSIDSSEILHKRLHKKYPKSVWAEKTPYYFAPNSY